MIKDEIQLLSNECCIVFDFGCYFPYSNFEVLTFDFSLGKKEFKDYKINHRYVNKGYQTISKQYGRKVSKIGYPYVMKLTEQSTMLLYLRVGIEKQYLTHVFQIRTSMTKEKPICGLSLRYLFDKNEFFFMSDEKAENVGWYQHVWRNHKTKDGIKGDNDIQLNVPYWYQLVWQNHKTEDGVEGNNDIQLNVPSYVSDYSHLLFYDTIIEPCPVALPNLLL